jgi:diacylglycerol kinase (ATP)
VGIHAALAVHPGSGHGAAAKIAGTVADRLREGVDRLDLLVATTVAESRELVKRSGDDGMNVLVVLGGDGAAHQGVQFCAGTDVALGLVPAGTGNDLARALGSPADPLAAVEALVANLRAGTRRRIDLGKVGGTWFATVLCCGFDACVSARANRMRWPPGPRRYDVAIVAELAAFRAQPVIIQTDVETLELDATLVAVGNTAWYGAGVPICPGAQPDDGLFDVTVVGKVTRRELLRMLPSLRAGRHLEHDDVRTLKAHEIRLDGNNWPAYADGESLGALPLSARCVPGALTLVADAETR